MKKTINTLNPQSKRPYHRPSDLSRCIRQVVMEHFFGIPETPAELQTRFDIGTWLHLGATKALELEGWDVMLYRKGKVEFSLPKLRFKVISRGPDALAKNGDWYLFELKTVSRSRFDDVVKNGEKGAVYQANCYIDMLKAIDYIVNPNKIFVRYINRENGYSHDIFDEYSNRHLEVLERIESHIEDGSLPEHPFTSPSHPACQFCPFLRDCWESFKKESRTELLQEDDELFNLIEVAYQMAETKKAVEDEYKLVRKQIEELMVRRGISEARTPYAKAQLSIRTSRRLDTKKLPKEIRDNPAYYTESTYSTLTIRGV